MLIKFTMDSVGFCRANEIEPSLVRGWISCEYGALLLVSKSIRFDLLEIMLIVVVVKIVCYIGTWFYISLSLFIIDLKQLSAYSSRGVYIITNRAISCTSLIGSFLIFSIIQWQIQSNSCKSFAIVRLSLDKRL